MTIAPLPLPYLGDTHVRIHSLLLDVDPGVVHFRLGRFVLPEGELPPEMPYNDVDAPDGWSESAGLSSATSPNAVYYVARLHLDSDGKLYFTINEPGGTGFIAKVRTVSSVVATLGGKCVHVAVVRNAAGNAGMIYLNGVASSESVAGYTGSWQTLSVTSTYLHFAYDGTGGYNTANLLLNCASLYNLALSPADVLEIYEGGGAVPERFKFGTQQNILTASFGNSGGSGGYETFSGQSVAGFTAANSNLGGNAASTLVPPVLIGAQYRIRGSITLNSGSLPSALLYDPTWSFQLTNTPALTAGSFDLVLNATASGLTGCRVAIQTPINSDFVLSGVTLQRLGAVIHLPLNDGLGFQLQDASTNRLHALATTTGVSHVAPLNGPARFRFTSTSSSAGFGRAVIPALSQILKVRARALTGAPTVRLGTTTSGQEIVASNMMGTNVWKDFTIALTGGIVTAAADLFVTQDSAVTIEWDITWEPLSP